MDKPHYRPEIDGLRALAVAAVVLFHLGAGLPGGYVGVDVFFVISGYLITGIIQRGLERSTFTLAEFWERRVRRILPALLVMVAGTLAAGCAMLLPHELEELSASSVAQALLLANVHFWRDTGYFAGPAELKPLLHTWSLAVEEQFYLLFPLILVLFRKQSRQRLFWGLACLAGVSLATCVYATECDRTAAFFLAPMRAWELLVGSMLAVWPWEIASRPRRDGTLAIGGLLAILLAVFTYDAETPFPGFAALAPVLGAAAIIFTTTATPGLTVGRALSLSPVVFIGKISYSLYLWHWPVIVYVRIYWGHLGWQEAALALAVSLLLAVLSWRFIETPLRHEGYLRQRDRLFVTAFATNGAVLAAGVFLAVTGGLPSRFPEAAALLADATWTGSEYRVGEKGIHALPTLGVPRASSEDGDRVDFVLWGDSQAMALSRVFDEAAKAAQLSGRAILLPGTVPLPNVTRPALHGNDYRALNEQIQDFLRVHRPRHIFLVCRWNLYTMGHTDLTSSFPSPLLVDDGRLQPGSIEDGLRRNEEILLRNIAKLVAFCEASQTTLWFVKQVPETLEEAPAKELFLASVGRKLEPSNRRSSATEHRRRSVRIDELTARISSECFRVVDFASLFFDADGLIINYRDGRALYKDSSHLSLSGTRVLTEAVSEILQRAKHETPTEGVAAGSQRLTR